MTDSRGQAAAEAHPESLPWAHTWLSPPEWYRLCNLDSLEMAIWWHNHGSSFMINSREMQISIYFILEKEGQCTVCLRYLPVLPSEAGSPRPPVSAFQSILSSELATSHHWSLPPAETVRGPVWPRGKLTADDIRHSGTAGLPRSWVPVRTQVTVGSLWL